MEAYQQSRHFLDWGSKIQRRDESSARLLQPACRALTIGVYQLTLSFRVISSDRESEAKKNESTQVAIVVRDVDFELVQPESLLEANIVAIWEARALRCTDNVVLEFSRTTPGPSLRKRLVLHVHGRTRF